MKVIKTTVTRQTVTVFVRPQSAERLAAMRRMGVLQREMEEIDEFSQEFSSGMAEMDSLWDVIDRSYR